MEKTFCRFSVCVHQNTRLCSDCCQLRDSETLVAIRPHRPDRHEFAWFYVSVDHFIECFQNDRFNQNQKKSQ
jgi:hypothetical protein